MGNIAITKNDSLKLFKVSNKSNIKSLGGFRSAYVFGNDPQEAFVRCMNFLNQKRLANVYQGQQFQVTEIPIPDELVFGVEIDNVSTADSIKILGGK